MFKIKSTEILIFNVEAKNIFMRLAKDFTKKITIKSQFVFSNFVLLEIDSLKIKSLTCSTE
jgi:hypothetical protein